MKTISLLVLPLLSLILASCSQPVKATADSGRPKTLAGRLNEKTGFTQDSEGNWKPTVNRRSQFEQMDRDSPYFKGAFNKSNKEFNGGKKEYDKKSWWGNKDYALKEYTGNTDGSRFQTASRFGKQKSDLGDQTSRFASKSAREGGATYATSNAREANGKIIDRPSDAETDIRRRVFTPPSVIDWKEQRSMNIKETKGILGKE